MRPIVGSESAVVFSNPTRTDRDSANRLSLCLYQITEDDLRRTNRCYAACVELRLVMCIEEGREETVTDLVTLQYSTDSQHI
jgi:hypothetical protein